MESEWFPVTIVPKGRELIGVARVTVSYCLIDNPRCTR